MSEVARDDCKMLKLLTGMKYSFPILFPFKHKKKNRMKILQNFKKIHSTPDNLKHSMSVPLSEFFKLIF